MVSKASLARKRWWASLTDEEKAEINRKRAEAQKKFWAGLSPSERMALRLKMSKGRTKKR